VRGLTAQSLPLLSSSFLARPEPQAAIVSLDTTPVNADAARWPVLEEHPHATIDEAVLAASSLAALTGVGHEEAASALRALAERATSRRRELRTFGTGSTLRRP
jgi:hypothetical protein